VRIGDEATMVIADIPGLIPGASEGAGLGHRFLKHVERTRALLHLVTLDFDEGRDPLKDYDALMTELERFDPELAKRPQIVAMTKSDLPEVREAYEQVCERFAKRGLPIHLVSSATGQGVRELSVALYKLVTGQSEIEDWDRPRAAPSASSAPSAPERTKKATAKKATAKKKKVATKVAARPKKVVAKKVPKTAPKKKAAAKKKATAKKTGTKKPKTKNAAKKTRRR
jgi:GTPase